MKTVSFTFEFDEENHDKLKEIAAEEHRTLAGQLRFIIDEWLGLYLLREKMASKKNDK